MSVTVEQATTLLIGPTFYWIVSGRNPALDARKMAEAFMDELRSPAA